MPEKNVIARKITIDDLMGMKIFESACNLHKSTKRKRNVERGKKRKMNVERESREIQSQKRLTKTLGSS